MLKVVNEMEQVVVLADWDGEGASGDDQVLVVFEDRKLVDGLYALVASHEAIRQAIRLSSEFRVLGASIEVESPSVRAWEAVVVGGLGESIGLGDGLLVSGGDMSAVRRGREVERPILEVRDDGMLLVKSGEGWATIDLTALAAECRSN